MPGDVAGGDEGEDVGLACLEVRMAEDLDGGVLDRPVPENREGVARLGRAMADAVPVAHALEDAAAEAGLDLQVAATMLG